MVVLLINRDPYLGPILENRFKKLKISGEVFTACSNRHAWNYLLDTRGITAVFMGFHLDGNRNNIQNGLVRAFLRAGFGLGGKALVATSFDHNSQLVRAGCSFETDMTINSFEKIVKQIKDEEEFRYQMLRTG